MGVISESAIWEDSVLQIEVGDSVGGGSSAVANLQAQDLANRTKWLKDNKFDANNFGEFYPTGVTPTYVDANNFTVSGDLTAIFTKGRVLKITDTGGTFNAVCVSSSYDSGTELTTVTVAGDTIDSGLSAVLYAVQQVTGQIWESGSNANGTYIKFADGTMICYGAKEFTCPSLTTSGNIYLASGISLGLFPIAFLDPPRVSLAFTCANQRIWATQPSSTTTNLIFDVFAATATTAGNPAGAHFMAIGRWY